jgi:hypothetical protein
MIAVIKGDIIASRKLTDQDKWLTPLRSFLEQCGKTPETWELVWGDFFQVEVQNPEEALHKTLNIKSLIKKIKPVDANRKISTIDARMAIGIGDKTYHGKRISESNGTAFIHAGEQFSKLKKEKTNLAVQSHWKDFDDEINLYLRLADTFMDRWSVYSAELMQILLNNPNITQSEIGKKLGIKQSAVSRRWSRANADEVLDIERVFRQKIKQRLT